jgi:hypothetical protein
MMGYQGPWGAMYQQPYQVPQQPAYQQPYAQQPGLAKVDGAAENVNAGVGGELVDQQTISVADANLTVTRTA